MESDDYFLAFHPSDTDVGDLYASTPSVLHSTPMNASTMAEIFEEIVGDLPSMLNTLQELNIPPTESVPAVDDASPTVSASDPDPEAGVDAIALQFASNHPTPLAVLFGEFGVHGWVSLCNRLVLKYSARIRIESLRAFRQRRPEDIIEFIQSEYEEMVRQGGIIFEDEEIQIDGNSVRTRINVPGFLRILVQMVSEDVPRVIYAAWLEAAKNITTIILQQYDADEQTSRARMHCSHGTHHGIYSYNFFHDFGASPDATAVLFSGTQARRVMALALRNTAPLVGGTVGPPALNTLFGIFDCIRGDDGNLRFRLLQSSPLHTTNLVTSMVLLVMDMLYIRNRHFPTLSERRLVELKDIYDSNKLTFRDVVACSQVYVPMAMQKLFCHNLLNILPSSTF
ncbi:hypothetical protein EDD15DRAFT_2368538 [Pisolithus albus]|nr:hypothetical protein EDD15DRAFT_2368538 [Pisolithus albus]